MTDNFFEKFSFDHYYLPYSGKVGDDNVWQKWMDEDFGKSFANQ